MASTDSSLLPNHPERAPAGPLDWRGVRMVLALIGWASLGLGILTLFVPLFPTTIFLLLALWALSQSSSPGYLWLRNHPKLGPAMREWDEYGVIAPRAKLFAIAGLASSGGTMSFLADENWTMRAVVGVVLMAIACYIATRPSEPEADA